MTYPAKHGMTSNRPRPEEVTDEMIDDQDKKLSEAIYSLGKSIARILDSHDALLAAAREAIEMADLHCTLLPDGTPNRTAECQHSYELMQAAIAKAEELKP
jgi:hypothetical protein